MSDERDPDRIDGSHPDEPRDQVPEHEEGHEEATRSGAASEEPISPYGPAATAEPAVEAAPSETRADTAAPAATDADAGPVPSDPATAADASGPDYAPPTAAPAYAAAPPSGAVPPYAAAPPYVSGEPPRPRGGKGLAIAALVVGIAGFLGAFIPFLNYVTAVPALVAVVLGIVSLARRMDGKPLALTGLILGAVGFVLSIVLAFVYTFAFVSSVTDAVESAGADSGFASPAPTDAFGDDDATAQPGTSPDDPLPIGTPVTGEGIDGAEWQVTLGTPILDATAAVLAADPSNEAPADGMQYAVVPVTATYLGSSTGDPLSELAVGFLASDGSQYSAADSFVQAPAPAFTDADELLEPQGTATGNVVIEIPIDGAQDGLWATAPGMIADAYYFRAG